MPFSPNVLRFGCGIAVLAACSALPGHAADPGFLDPTFGSGGATVVAFDAIFGGYDDAAGVAVAPDGSVAVGGLVQTSSVSNVEYDFGIAKLGANGILANPWGTLGNGRAIVTADSPGTPRDEHLFSLAVDAGGKIVTGGWRYDGGFKALVSRLNANGTPDSSFSSDGKTLLSSGHAVTGVGFDSEGRVSMATAQQASTATSYALRLTATSSGEDAATLDTGFATDGVATIANEYANDALVLPDDGVLVGSTPNNNQNLSVIRLRRFTAGGVPDSAFGGGDGLEEALFGAPDEQSALRALAFDPRGRFVALGTFENPDQQWVLARFLSDGDLDDSFGSAGIVFLGADAGLGFDPTDIAVQSDGKVVLVGAGLSGYIARYDVDGELDTTFFAPFGSRSFGYETPTDVAGATSVAIGPDGRIVVAGYSVNENDIGNRNFAVARFESGVVFCDGFESQGIYGVSRWSAVAP